MKKVYINGIAIVIAGVGIFMLFWNFTQLIEKHRKDQQANLLLWKKSIQAIATLENPVDVSFIFDEIIKKIDFPVILSDKANNVVTYKNIQPDIDFSATEKKEFFKNLIQEMDKRYLPIAIEVDGQVLQKIHYTDPPHVGKLQTLSVIMPGIVIFCLLLMYWNFSIARKREFEKLWVSMAKEMAHQFGTPLSALVGWADLLRLEKISFAQQQNIALGVQDDVSRLNKVLSRFSKIGSQDPLKNENIYRIVEDTFHYFKKRLPRLRKNISLKIKGERSICAPVCLELVGWVFENIVKNAIDAISSDEGEIVAILEESKKTVTVQFVDNGKGIERSQRMNIFNPGVTSKEKGWGLGLALARRIMVDYHKGKIFANSTDTDSRTVITIIFRK